MQNTNTNNNAARDAGKPQKIEIKFKETATASGNIFRLEIAFNGVEYRLEMGLDKKWLNIIERGGGCEEWRDNGDGDGLQFTSGEHVTNDWTQEQIESVDKAAEAVHAAVIYRACLKGIVSIGKKYGRSCK